MLQPSRYVALVAMALLLGCGSDRPSPNDEAPSVGRAASAPGAGPSGAPKKAPEQQSAVDWWERYVKALRAAPVGETRVLGVNTRSERDCTKCDPNVPEVYRRDVRLAEAAMKDMKLDRTIGPFLVCGVPDRDGRFTDCVAIRIGDRPGRYTVEGSGVLVDGGTAVLTARHVWNRVGTDPTLRVVVADQASSTDASRLFTVTRPTHAHPQGADLVKLTLDRPVPAELYTPHDIADPASIAKGSRLVLSGYGIDAGGDKGARRIVNVHVAEAPCDATDPIDYGCTPTIEFVAAEPVAWCDSCSYDSGGPAYVEVRPGVWAIVGIIKGPIPQQQRRALCRERTGACGCGSILTYAIQHEQLK